MPIDNRFVALKSYNNKQSVDNVNKLLIAFDADISRMCNSAYYKYDLHSYTDGVAGVKSKLYEKLFDKEVLKKFRFEDVGEKLAVNFQKFIWGTLAYIAKEIRSSIAIKRARFVPEDELTIGYDKPIEQSTQFDLSIDDEIIELYRRFGKHNKELLSIYLDVKLRGRTITETADKFGKSKNNISLILHNIKKDIQYYRQIA